MDARQLCTVDAKRLRQMFDTKTLTISQLVSMTLDQIKYHNRRGLKLNAIISTAPEQQLLELAEQLDKELQKGRSRGRLHGIPIVLTDCIATSPDLGMSTSAGNFALLETKVTESAPIVKRLLDSGAIIIGKSNLTELCAFKGENLIDGFSPVGGQTLSPYVYRDIGVSEGGWSLSSPGGSSSGSAVSVSSGFSVIGIGTENNGSIVQPASRQALYAVKPSRDLVTAEGCWAVSTLDVPGAMARSVHDVAVATEALLDPLSRAKLPNWGYMAFLDGSFEGMTIGFVDPVLWRLPLHCWTPSDDAKRQHDVTYDNAAREMEELGATVTRGVNLPLSSHASITDGYAPYIVNSFEHEETVGQYFQGYTDRSSSIRDLASVVDFNNRHTDTCLPIEAPDQSWLIKAIHERPSEQQYHDAVVHMANITVDLNETFDYYKLDVFIAPMDSWACSLSTASGCPIANVPVGRYMLNGEPSRPFGLAVLARRECEGTLFQFMSAYESAFPRREVPERLRYGLEM